MGWLSGYRKRIAGTHRYSSGGTVQFSLSFPAYHDDFWNTVDSDGYGVRVTDADGVTQIAYQVVSFDQATRTGTLKVSNVATTDPGQKVFYLYYDPEDTPADGSTTVTVTTAADAKFDQQQPRNAFAPSRPEYGQTTPTQTVSKDSAEYLWIWFDITDAMEKPVAGTLYGHPRYEEVRTAAFSVEQGGSDQGSMYADANVDVIETLDGRTYVGGRVIGGTTANVYTGVMQVVTCIPGAPDTSYRIVEFRTTIQVQDLTEPS